MEQLITKNEHGNLTVRSLGTPGARIVILEELDDGDLSTIALLDRREIEMVIEFLSDTLDRWDAKGPVN